MIAAVLAAAAAVPAEAQDPDSIRLAPVPPDTLPRPAADSGPLVRPDSMVQDTASTDTLGPPPPQLPELRPPGPAGFHRGVWEWDRDALRMLPYLSLLQLLERVPGVVPVRADLANQAEGVAVFGATAGAVRYVVDGFELDPLTTPSFDPSRLPLLALERVRIERRVTGATVRLETQSPDDPRPRSIIEAGTGDYGVNLFRGIFLSPGVVGGPLSLGFERLATDGLLPGGGTNHTTGWVKWSWVRDRAGVQVEYRQSDMDRTGLGEGMAGARSDWVVRARGSRGPFTGEVYAGASATEEERGTEVVREGTPRGGARLRARLGATVEGIAAVRLRDHPRLPAQELELTLRAAPHPAFAVEAEAIQGRWAEGDASGRWSARTRLGPVLGLTVFGELFGGSPLVGEGPGLRLPAAVDSLSWNVTRDGVRAGAELRVGGLTLGAAAVRSTVEPVVGLGLSFEPSRYSGPGGEATGFEVNARLPTGWAPLHLEGWYVGTEAEGRLYTPRHQARGGLVYHHLPLESDNLEIFARLEHQYRDPMTVPADPATGAPTAVVEAYRATNFELSIRVVTVRAFVRWGNVLHRQELQDVPGTLLPGQHILYGVKWEFLN